MPFIHSLKKTFFFNSSRFRLYRENEHFAQSIPDHALVLDAGAGNQPYRHLLAHVRYEAADFELVNKEYARSTYVCDLKQIPVESERFDYIFFNQVMEHLPEPLLVLKELNRVLKSGGQLIYSGPLFYEEHEVPYDFYRYTQYALRNMFDKTGFDIERLEWLEGYFGTVGYQLNRMAIYLPIHPRDLGGGIMGIFLCPVMIMTKIFSGAFSILFHRMETRKKYTKKGYPKNYVAIIRKRKIKQQ